MGKGIPHSPQALTVKASQSQSKEDIRLKAGRNGEEPLKFYECNFTVCIMDLALKMWHKVHFPWNCSYMFMILLCIESLDCLFFLSSNLIWNGHPEGEEDLWAAMWGLWTVCVEPRPWNVYGQNPSQMGYVWQLKCSDGTSVMVGISTFF